MDHSKLENGPKRRIGVRGPFDDDKTADDVVKRVNEFQRRTGLQEYAKYFNSGAFLARRPFGKEQVEYLRKERKKEDEKAERLNGVANHIREGSGPERQGTDVGPTDTDDIRKLRYEYEDKQLEREGNRGRWHIYIRQNWHVHALIFCCSLGAVIQGWDETAVNGGKVYIAGLRIKLTFEQHSYTIQRSSRLRTTMLSSAFSIRHRI